MENYNQEKGSNINSDENDNGSNNLSQYVPSATSATPMLMTTTATGYRLHHHHHMNKEGGDYFHSALVAAVPAEENPVVKSERSHQQQPAQRFYHLDHLNLHRQSQELLAAATAAGGGGGSNNDQEAVEVMKAKIMAHPQYSNLLQAFMDCQKVGAPPEVAASLTAVRHEFETRHHQHRISSSSSPSSSSSKDPELDQFMEAYYDLLIKYRNELTKPVQEAIEFMSRVESQLNLLTDGHARIFTSDERSEGNNVGALSDDEQENSGGETELPEIDPRSEDRELKNHLLKKYSGYLGSLKQELSKKKKKGKLPKDARQKLLSWWELHYKWPYPSESEKVALAEATGLDQKQINNWFINQRKRHWKPSEDMQFMVMDGLLPPQNAATAFYMEGHYLGDGPYRFGT